MKSHRALVSSLDWGLGHTTRTVPIIRALLEENIEVVFAGTEIQVRWIEKSFPNIESEIIKGTNIHYNNSSVILSLIKQAPKIQSIISQNKTICQNLADRYGADIVLSDENPGFYSTTAHNVYVSHQLNIKGPFNSITTHLHNRILSRFQEVWIPDNPEVKLSGTLGHFGEKKDYRYVGLLSHINLEKDVTVENNFEFLGILSGPEPMRSQFHKKLRDFLGQIYLPCAIAGNSSLSFQSTRLAENITELGILQSTDLKNAILSSRKVVCRSGYSSLMDLTLLQKQALIEPTPGQYEQEYLYEHSLANNWFSPLSDLVRIDLNSSPAKVEPKKNKQYLKNAVKQLV